MIGAYIVALGISNGLRSRQRHGGFPDRDEREVTVTLPGAQVPVTVAYREVAPRQPSGLPVVLLHGSPGDNDEVAGVAEYVGRVRRTIAPDLPGFGGSTRRVPNYSIDAHARYVLAMLDSLRIPQAHILGFSMGGGVAISLANLAPERIASLTLLSALGAQEYELLGDYHLNHAIHGLQLAGLWMLTEGVPHFGALDGGFLTIAYARNFYDTDQRPLRQMLNRFQEPALIIQGDKDFLVDPAVAVESHRLVPQSEMIMFRDDSATHFMAFRRPDSLAALVGQFYTRAEAGKSLRRPDASPARIAAAGQPFDPATIPPIVGVALWVLLALLAAATLVSEDLAGIAAGLLIGRGTIGFFGGTMACLVGIVLGDVGLLLMGRWLGRAAIRRAPLRWFVSEGQIDRSATWFEQRGLGLIIVSRFIPGTRLPTYLAAGILHRNTATFVGACLVAAILWTPLLVGASALFGDRVLAAFTSYRQFALPAILVTAVALALVIKLFVPLFSWRGRRLLLSRWRRLTRWEFWPRWAFYPPVVVYVAWLALKHRSLTLFTAVNPAIPGGGFVGESKAQILGGLHHAPARVARWSLLPPASATQRLTQVTKFMTAHQLDFPIVLKPDVGERGGGVGILWTEEAVGNYLDQTGESLIVQEYVGGVEFGIFYYRLPGEPRGQIFAITDKQFPTVTGNGRASLERLILADDRTVSMARFFLTQNAARLESVPAAGEVIRLVELGTHCRGSAFFDGDWVRTPALEEAIDQLSQGYRGFWFGRYDIRAPSIGALQSGTGFKVLELNGATAEATSIYDPKNSIFDAYRVLRQQWTILFEIAAKNVANGAQPTTVGELFRLIDHHRKASRAHVGA